MEKEYQFEVKIISDCLITANNEKEAIQKLRDSWLDENDIDLCDKEISLIKVVKEKDNKYETKKI